MEEIQLSQIGQAWSSAGSRSPRQASLSTWAFQSRESGGKVETRVMAGELPEPRCWSQKTAPAI